MHIAASHECEGKTVLHDRACVRHLSLPRVRSPPCPAQLEALSSARAEQRACVHRCPKRSLQRTHHAFLKPRDPPRQEEEEDRQPFERISCCIISFRYAISVPENMCVYGCSTVPVGGGGGHLATVPQGWRGTVFPVVGQDKGGGYKKGMPDPAGMQKWCFWPIPLHSSTAPCQLFWSRVVCVQGYEYEGSPFGQKWVEKIGFPCLCVSASLSSTGPCRCWRQLMY